MSDPHLTPTPDALERLLGIAPAHRRERDLLNLLQVPATTEHVLLALKQQLARVAAHAEGMSPAGAEVRMLLHAAAARLLLAQDDASESSLPERPAHDALAPAPLGAPLPVDPHALGDPDAIDGPLAPAAADAAIATPTAPLEAARAFPEPDEHELSPINLVPLDLARVDLAPADLATAWPAPTSSLEPLLTHPLAAPSLLATSARSLDTRAHAMSVLARHGGWSPRAMQELAALAASQGVAPDAMQGWFLGIVQGEPASGPPGATPSALASGVALAAPGARRAQPARSPSHPGRRPLARPASRPRPPARVADPAIAQLAAMESASIGTIADPNATVDEGVEADEVASAEDPLRKLAIRAGLGVGLGVVALVTLAVGLRLMFPRAAPVATPGDLASSAGTTTPPPRELFPAPAARPQSGTQASPPGNTSQSPPASGVATTDPAPPDMSSLIAMVRAAVQDLDRDPAIAIDAFDRAMHAAPALWPMGSPDRFVAALDASTEYVYRAGARRDTSEAALAALSNSLDAWRRRPLDSDAVARSVWAGALAGRLVDEPDLSWSFRSRLRDALAASVGPVSLPQRATGQDAAAAMLQRLARQMLPDPLAVAGASPLAPTLTPAPRVTPDAWDAWVACVAASLDAPAARTGLQLEVLESALRAGVDPTRDASVAGAIRAIARSLPWDRASAARRRLVAWLGEGDADTVSLHALTTVVVGQKDSEADVSLVLSATATEADRRELRDRYASIWSLLDAVSQGETVRRITDALRQALSSATQGATPVERLARAARLAGLVTAAQLTWDNRPDDGADLLAGLEVARPLPSPAPLPPLDDSIATTWGDRYLAAGADILRRRDVIRQASGQPSRLEARIIVEEATRGPSAEVRREARKLFELHSGEVVLQLALLDFAPFIPATRDNSALIERATSRPLPSVRSPVWRVAARRAIVEALSQRLSPALGQGVDGLSADLADWYDRRRVVTPAAPAPVPGPVPLAPIKAAPSAPSASVQRYRANLTPEAQRGWSLTPNVPSVASILARLQQRRAAASGDPQILAAEQSAVVELLARVVVIERPVAAESIANVLADWQRDASRAQHVFEQLEAGEAAQARLWLLRLGEQAP